MLFIQPVPVISIKKLYIISLGGTHTVYACVHIEKKLAQKSTIYFGNLVNFVSGCLHQIGLAVEWHTQWLSLALALKVAGTRELSILGQYSNKEIVMYLVSIL